MVSYTNILQSYEYLVLAFIHCYLLFVAFSDKIYAPVSFKVVLNFFLQNNWVISLWNATLRWKGLMKISTYRRIFSKNLSWKRMIHQISSKLPIGIVYLVHVYVSVSVRVVKKVSFLGNFVYCCVDDKTIWDTDQFLIILINRKTLATSSCLHLWEYHTHIFKVAVIFGQ